MKSILQRLESWLDSVISKNNLEIQTKGNSSSSKWSKASPSKEKNDEMFLIRETNEAVWCQMLILQLKIPMLTKG